MARPLITGVETAPAVEGHCDTAFGAVGDIFRDSFRDDAPDIEREHGAALAIVVDGRLVVDLWGGWADRAGTRPWRYDTPAMLMSLSKALAALAILKLVEAGTLDLHRPIAAVWPAFGANGKRAITPAQLLDHSAGVPALADGIRNIGFAQDVWERAIEAAEPLHPPGERHIYHAVTQGFILAAVAERVGTRSLPDLFDTHFAAPLGIRCTFGVPPGTAHAESPMSIIVPRGPLPLAARTTAAMRDKLDFNDPDMLAVPVPAFNAFATARDVARLFAGLIARGGPLAADILAKATTERWHGVEETTGSVWRMGLGLMLSSPFADFGPGARAFGHPGSGGVTGFADPDRRVAFGYTPTRPTGVAGTGPRAKRLVTALAHCL